jgi:thiol-disulfide isomerase/thioredoxin
MIKTTSLSCEVLLTGFWASSRAPCRAEMSAPETIQRFAKDNGRVVAVNIEERDTFRNVTPDLAD